MQIEKNIQKISLVFFFVLGLANLLGYLMLINNYMPEIANAVKTISEIPFILCAAVYGFVSLKISLESPGKRHSISNILFILFILALFALLIYINLFIPDRI
ncbi:hypothetical protein JW911_02210 [Candidatus Peregrinibacteria bacterium]|nr:hypothetical protein [Candidatus Peregrinibacteria bacterium]